MSEIFITIGEYIEYKQPAVYEAFKPIIERMKRLAELDKLSFREWQYIMTERPKPGRAGILPRECDTCL